MVDPSCMRRIKPSMSCNVPARALRSCGSPGLLGAGQGYQRSLATTCDWRIVCPQMPILVEQARVGRAGGRSRVRS
jgi:hypothetical protein